MMPNRAIRLLQRENAFRFKPVPDVPRLITPVKPRVNQWNGDREINRRKRQIATGILKAQNGLRI